MAFTDKTERGFEDLIVNSLVKENGYELGTKDKDSSHHFNNDDYDPIYAMDTVRLFRFLNKTQPVEMDKLGVNKSDQKKRQFLTRLSNEIRKRGIIDVLRNGIHAYPADLILFYFLPTENNKKAKDLFDENIFSVMRQLHYSTKDTGLALDLCLFINGLPVITIELKNHYTGQTVTNAIEQYKNDRDPHELLFPLSDAWSISHWMI